MSSDELLLVEFKELELQWKAEVINLLTRNCSEADSSNWIDCKCLLTSSTVPANFFLCKKFCLLLEIPVIFEEWDNKYFDSPALKNIIHQLTYTGPP